MWGVVSGEAVRMLVPRWRVGRGLVLHDKAVSMVEVFPSGDRLLTWGRERVAAVGCVQGSALGDLCRGGRAWSPRLPRHGGTLHMCSGVSGLSMMS